VSEFKFHFSSVVFESHLAIDRWESIGLVQIETLEQKIVLVSGHINSRVTALDWYGCLPVWGVSTGQEMSVEFVYAGIQLVVDRRFLEIYHCCWLLEMRWGELLCGMLV
jgi:hypothetical protein